MVSKVHRRRVKEAVALVFRLHKAEIISADRDFYFALEVEIDIVRKCLKCKFAVLVSLTDISHVREYLCEGTVGCLIPERFLSVRECQCRVRRHDIDALCVDSECHICEGSCPDIRDTDDSGSGLLRRDGKFLSVRVVEETSKVLLLAAVSTADLAHRHGRFLCQSRVADTNRNLHGISENQI